MMTSKYMLPMVVAMVGACDRSVGQNEEPGAADLGVETEDIARLAGTADEVPTADATASLPVLRDMAALHRKELAFAGLAAEKAGGNDVRTYASMLVEDHTRGLEEVQQAAVAGGVQLDDTQEHARGEPATPGVTATPPQDPSGGDGRMGTPGTINDPVARNTPNPVADEQAGRPVGIEEPVTGAATPSLGVGRLDAEAQATIERLTGLSGADFDREFIDLMVMEHEKGIARLQGVQASVAGQEAGMLIERQLPVLQKHLEEAKRIQASLGASANR